MNSAFLSHLPKLQMFITGIKDEKSLVDLSKLQNVIDIKLQQNSISLNEVLHFYEYCQSQEFLKMHSSRNWTDEEWKVLLWVIEQYCMNQDKNSEEFQKDDWVKISEIIAFKDSLNCQFKWLSHLKNIQTNKNWPSEEDKLLYKIMTKEPNIKWFEVQYEMFVLSDGIYFRKAKQYRERWNNYLNPQVNRGIWTELDDYNLLQIALVEGLRWSNISKKLKNRTENQVKNRFKSIINKEKKITQIPQEIEKDQSEDPSKHGLDKSAEFLIHSILNRLKPVERLQNPNLIMQEQSNSNNEQSYAQIPQFPLIMNPQQYYFNQYQQLPQMTQLQQLAQLQQIQQMQQIPQIPQIPQISQIPQIPQIPQQINQIPQIQQISQLSQIPQVSQIPQMQTQFQQLNQQQQIQQQGLSIQIPQQQQILSQQYLQQQLQQQQQQQQQSLIQNFYQGQLYQQQFVQQQQQSYKFNVYASQQNTPTNSIGTLSSQRSEKLISDQIKEEENSGSSSNKEPKVQKMVCVSGQSSINGSTSSVNSFDAIKQNFNNMHIDSEQNSPDQIQRRKHQRSQSGAFDISNQGKVKAKRSRFYYASNDG